MSSKVFFIKAAIDDGEHVISEKARRLFKAGKFRHCFRQGDFTAVKVHVGEPPNNTYIKSPCIKGLVEELLALRTKPFIADTSALYTGRRHNAIDHAILADEHGFNISTLGIPFIAPDGIFGTSETAVQIDGELNDEVLIASDIVRCQSILSIAHFTGHPATCAAATLKTLGMGCSSRKGKMRQHASMRPSVSDDCTLCGDCFKHCPAEAITLGDVKASIDSNKCIGCGECVAVCRFDAVKYDWGAENPIVQKSIAEHALGVLKNKKERIASFNFVISVTRDCDCFDKKDMQKIVDDIGILASTDPVAVDKASIDIVESKTGKTIAELLRKKELDPRFQIEHAERLGLGSSDYELIEIE
jgi:uncharacterized Fe-S center protein